MSVRGLVLAAAVGCVLGVLLVLVGWLLGIDPFAWASR